METPRDGLRRGFGLSTTTYVVIAGMVGTGILVSPGYLMASLRSYPAVFGLWTLGGLLAMCGALCVAEPAASLPRAGGEYVYLRETYGPMPLFLSGWTSFPSRFLGAAGRYWPHRSRVSLDTFWGWLEAKAPSLRGPSR